MMTALLMIEDSGSKMIRHCANDLTINLESVFVSYDWAHLCKIQRPLTGPRRIADGQFEGTYGIR